MLQSDADLVKGKQSNSKISTGRQRETFAWGQDILDLPTLFFFPPKPGQLAPFPGLQEVMCWVQICISKTGTEM